MASDGEPTATSRTLRATAAAALAICGPLTLAGVLRWLEPPQLLRTEVYRTGPGPATGVATGTDAVPFLTLHYREGVAPRKKPAAPAPPAALVFPGRGSNGATLRDLCYALAETGLIAGAVTFSDGEFGGEEEETRARLKDVHSALHAIDRLFPHGGSPVALIGHSDGAVPLIPASRSRPGIGAVVVIGKTVDLAEVPPATMCAAWLGLFDQLNSEEALVRASGIPAGRRHHPGIFWAGGGSPPPRPGEGNAVAVFVSPFSDHFTETADPVIARGVARQVRRALGAPSPRGPVEPFGVRGFRPFARGVAVALVLGLPLLMALAAARLLTAPGCAGPGTFTRYLISGLLAVPVMAVCAGVFPLPAPVTNTGVAAPAKDSAGAAFDVRAPVKPFDAPLYLLVGSLTLVAVNGRLRRVRVREEYTGAGEMPDPPPHFPAPPYPHLVIGALVLLFLTGVNLALTDAYLWEHIGDFAPSLPLFFFLYPVLLLSQFIDRVALFLAAGAGAGLWGLLASPGGIFLLALVVSELAAPGWVRTAAAHTRRALVRPRGDAVGFLHFDKRRGTLLLALVAVTTAVWVWRVAEGAIDRELLRTLAGTLARTALLPSAAALAWLLGGHLIGRHSKRVFI